MAESMTIQNKDKSRKVFNPDFLTPQERQDRIVEILTRGILRLIEKNRQTSQSQVVTRRNPEAFTDERNG